jgi:hypothetical protein
MEKTVEQQMQEHFMREEELRQRFWGGFGLGAACMGLFFLVAMAIIKIAMKACAP